MLSSSFVSVHILPSLESGTSVWMLYTVPARWTTLDGYTEYQTQQHKHNYHLTTIRERKLSTNDTIHSASTMNSIWLYRVSNTTTWTYLPSYHEGCYIQCNVKRYNQIPYPALKTKREITKYINWQQFMKSTCGKPNEQLFSGQVVIQLPKIKIQYVTYIIDEPNYNEKMDN